MALRLRRNTTRDNEDGSEDPPGARSWLAPLAAAPERGPSEWTDTTAPLMILSSNAVPIIGVVFLKWQCGSAIGAILMYFWVETAVLVLFALLRFRAIQTAAALADLTPLATLRCLAHAVLARRGRNASPRPSPWPVIGGYAVFMFVHGVIVMALFIGWSLDASQHPDWRGVGSNVLWVVVVGAITLTIQHGHAFWIGFIGRREYQSAVANREISRPLPRIMVMHFGLLLGGALASTFSGTWSAPGVDSLLAAAIILVGLKTVIELLAWALSIPDRSVRRLPAAARTAAVVAVFSFALTMLMVALPVVVNASVIEDAWFRWTGIRIPATAWVKGALAVVAMASFLTAMAEGARRCFGNPDGPLSGRRFFLTLVGSLALCAGVPLTWLVLRRFTC